MQTGMHGSKLYCTEQLVLPLAPVSLPELHQTEPVHPLPVIGPEGDHINMDIIKTEELQICCEHEE